MILFLRDKRNRTIAEVDCYVKSEDGRKFVELHASINIEEYSELLLQSIIDPFVWTGDIPSYTQELISDFAEIDELRGWLWERYQNTEPEEYDNIINILQKRFKEIADKHNLKYLED